MSVLTLQLSSCRTTQNKIIWDVPEIVKPEFPKPAIAELNEDEKTVTVDLEWFLNIAKYKIEVEKEFEYLEKLKELNGYEY